MKEGVSYVVKNSDVCPICGYELTIDDIDYQSKGDKLISILYCPNYKCNFKKKYDETYIEDVDDIADEEDEDFDSMNPSQRLDEDAEDEDGP